MYYNFIILHILIYNGIQSTSPLVTISPSIPHLLTLGQILGLLFFNPLFVRDLLFFYQGRGSAGG